MIELHVFLHRQELPCKHPECVYIAIDVYNPLPSLPTKNHLEQHQRQKNSRAKQQRGNLMSDQVVKVDINDEVDQRNDDITADCESCQLAGVLKLYLCEVFRDAGILDRKSPKIQKLLFVHRIFFQFLTHQFQMFRKVQQIYLLPKSQSSVLIRSTFVGSSVFRAVSFNSKHISKVYGLGPSEAIDEITNILQKDKSSSEAVLLLNHVKNLITSAKLGEFQRLGIAYHDLRSKYMAPLLSDDQIQNFNSEELYACINNLFPSDKVETAGSCIAKLYDLIQKDVSSESTKIDEEGRITVDQRILEPHLFSKILAAMAYNPELYLQATEIQDLAEYALAYIKRHSLNFSFQDKCIALTCVLSFSNPSPGNQRLFNVLSNTFRAHQIRERSSCWSHSFHTL